MKNRYIVLVVFWTAVTISNAKLLAKPDTRLQRLSAASGIVAVVGEGSNGTGISQSELNGVAATLAQRWRGRIRIAVVGPNEPIDARKLAKSFGERHSDIWIITDGTRFDLWAQSLSMDVRNRAIREAQTPGSYNALRRLVRLVAEIPSGWDSSKIDVAGLARDLERHELDKMAETIRVLEAAKIQSADFIAQIVPKMVSQGEVALSEELPDRIRPDANALASSTGARVYVVHSNTNLSLRTLLAMYDDLGFTGRDLLFVTNGLVWEVRCDALGENAVRKLLRQAVQSERRTDLGLRFASISRTFRRAFDEPQHTATQVSEPVQPVRQSSPGNDTEVSLPSPLWQYVGLAMCALGMAFVLYWRRKLIRSRAEKIHDTVCQLESLLTQIFLDLETSRNDSIAREAVELRDRVTLIKNSSPSRKTLAFAEQSLFSTLVLERKMRS